MAQLISIFAPDSPWVVRLAFHNFQTHLIREGCGNGIRQFMFYYPVLFQHPIQSCVKHVRLRSATKASLYKFARVFIELNEIFIAVWLMTTRKSWKVEHKYSGVVVLIYILYWHIQYMRKYNTYTTVNTYGHYYWTVTKYWHIKKSQTC